MRTLIISIIILIFSNCYTQEKSILELQQWNMNEEKQFDDTIDYIDTTINKGWNLENLPLQFGLELGTSPIRKNTYAYIGLIGSMDLAIYRRTLFLRIEYGKLGVNNELYEKAGQDYPSNGDYGSLGLNYLFLKHRKSRLFAYLGLGAAGSKEGYLTLLVSLRYVYTINRYIGISSSIRYPVVSISNPFIAIGLQFLNN